MPSIFECHKRYYSGLMVLALLCGGCSTRSVGPGQSGDSDSGPDVVVVENSLTHISPNEAVISSSATPGSDANLTFTATHRQSNIINVTDDQGESVRLHTFCLDAQGNILAGIGQAPGQIRKLDPGGNPLATWPLDIQPEAIAVGPDATVYVAGSGKLLKLDNNGTVLLEADAPHVVQARASNQQVKQSKLAASSISAAGGDVFLATRALEGYGFAIWRLDEQLENAENIVSGLRGCCGQMDVQANEKGVYVAENSRHRVCHYDREGTLITQWGSRARSGAVGFGGCCNPMNLAFGSQHDVYTAESSTGRIKRYGSNGDLLDLVGRVEIVPGCKKVSIAVSPDGGRIYMLDITRTHIVLMESISAPVQVAAATPGKKN